ncbi:MAG: hypothetical protein Q8P13_01940 [bacterium]|nr:hypothetical protein [bacterium]
MTYLRKFLHNKIYLGSALAAVLLLSIGGGYLLLAKNSANPKTNSASSSSAQKETQGGSRMGDPNSTDPVEKGKALSGGNCSGTGSKKLNSAPMRIKDISYIQPYGLLAGPHVTPIDHGYYWGKVPFGDPDLYDVLALSDGKIVNIGYRDRSGEGRKVKGDYRVVISYSCTFFSYFDLATSLDPAIRRQLPKDWEKADNKVVNTDINIKEGQVLAKFGGQSLDFAVWDTTKQLKNLLVPTAYNNAEPWKINTVNPLEYFSDSVKSQILPFYLRKVEPLDGVIDQDIDGKAAGNWFAEGTNGYAGVFSYGSAGGGQNNYWAGHLALVHDLYEPSGWVFSIGNLNGEAKQFGIKAPSPTPDKLEIASGLVKYEIGAWQHVETNGNVWLGKAFPTGGLKMKVGNSQGTVLVQLLEKRKLKIEVFLNKTPSQVSGFTSAARIYDRGDNAKMIKSNTAT